MAENYRLTFDLGISYNKNIVQRLFGYFYRKDRPAECSQLLEECDSFFDSAEGMNTIGSFVRWGSSNAYDNVDVAFGHDGKLKLVLGWQYRNSRYTPKAVTEICKKVIQIILALEKHRIIEGCL